MKKTLLALLACAAGFQAQAQTDSERAFVRTKYNGSLITNTQLSGVAAKGPVQTPPSIATTIFSEDFASGIPATWTNVALVGAEIWSYTTTGSASSPSGSPVSLSATGTSAANGYMIFDSDAGGQTSGPEDAELTSGVINCTGYNTVYLSFNDHFVQYAASQGIVLVSNDGTTWTDVYHAETGFGQNQGSTNPRAVQVDITSVAANQATVYVRFKYTGSWDWFWMVDDVTLFEPAAADAGVSAISSPTDGCGLSSTSSVTVDVKNFGSSPISNVPVSMTLNGGAPINETVPGPISPNSVVSYTFNTTVNLSTAGTYTIQAYTGLSGDSNNANDSISATVENIQPTSLATPYTMDFETGEDLSQWAVADANGDGTSWAIFTTLAYSGAQCLRKAGSGSFDDDWVWTGCLDLQAGVNYNLNYWFRQFDLTAPCSLEVFLATAQTVAASTQPIVVEGIDTTYFNSVNNFTVPTSGSYHIAWHAFVPTTSTVQGSSSVRIDLINIGLATGIGENSNPGGVQVYPNPNTGIFNLRVMKFENALVRIFNMIGEEVSNFRMNDIQEQIDLSTFAKGIYMIKVEGNSFSTTQKVTVN